MLALDSYGRALLAISCSAGDTQRCSSARADSRLDLCQPSSLSGHRSQKLWQGTWCQQWAQAAAMLGAHVLRAAPTVNEKPETGLHQVD